jgi:uncharacterized RDD family membrane protein YckC
MAAFVYEGVLLFGVVNLAGYFYATFTQQRHAIQGRAGLQIFLLLVLAIYFVWFWSRSGQTLAMKTWRIRLVDAQGRVVGQGRALLRFALAWLWFVPALVTTWLVGVRSSSFVYVLLLVGVIAYALLARLHPSRQFIHDRLVGTRLVDVPRSTR